MDYTIEESMIITGKKEVYAMRDERKFKNQWELKRQKGPLYFVMVNSLKIATLFLCGVIFGSVAIYNHPIVYSIEHYYLTYILTFSIGLLLGLVGHSIFWKKNEDKYKKLTKNEY